MWLRTFDLGSKDRTGRHWTGPVHCKCSRNGAIVLLYCVCSTALIGTFGQNGPIFKRHLSTFFFLFTLQFITLFWPHVRERCQLIPPCLIAALVDNWCHLVSGSSLTHWSNLGLGRPHETASLHWSPGASLSRQASSRWVVHTPVHVSSWKISHNPLCLTPANMWARRCRWSPIGPSASRAEVSHQLFANLEVGQEQWNVTRQIKAVRWTFFKTDWRQWGVKKDIHFFHSWKRWKKSWANSWQTVGFTWVYLFGLAECCAFSKWEHCS